MKSLQEIAGAWATWSAMQFNTRCRLVATTNFKDMPNGLKPYQCVARIQRLDYDGATVPTDSSAIAYEQWYDNDTSRDQSMRFSYETTTIRTFEWSVEATIEVGSELTISVGVPEVAGASKKIHTTFTLSTKTAGSYTDDQKWAVDLPVIIPEMKSVHCEMLIYKQTYDIRFVANVLLTNCIGVIFTDPIDFNRNGGAKYRNWVQDIREGFRQGKDNNLADTSGYRIADEGGEILVPGVFKGSQGISTRVKSREYPVRNSTYDIPIPQELLAEYRIYPLAIALQDGIIPPGPP